MNIRTPSDPHCFAKKTIFLAGTTDPKISGNWQEWLAQHLQYLDVDILNPRLNNWFSKNEQNLNTQAFTSQLSWELEGLENADLVVMYFKAQSTSPITLIEFGLTANSGRLVVCCEKGFWQYGNVEFICHQCHVPMVESFPELLEIVEEKVAKNETIK